MTAHPSTRFYSNSQYFASSRFKFLTLPFVSFTAFNPNNHYATAMVHKDYPDVGGWLQANANSTDR
jgi:hypothetical protein